MARSQDAEPTTRLVQDGDRLVRVAGRSGAASTGAGPGAFVVCALTGLVAYFYFDVGLWTAVAIGLFAPLLLALGVLAVFLLIGVTAAPFYHLTRFRRNRELRRLVTAVLSGDKPKRIILFLRQFQARGGRVRLGVVRRGEDPFGDDDHDRYFLESWADELSTDTVHVVKVADRSDATIAGSVRLDDASWQDDVLRLMAAAEAILLVPGAGEGLHWEFAQIVAQGKLPVTTIVMPFGERVGGSDPVWESCRARYRAAGFELPPFRPDGLLMKFNQSGTLTDSTPIVGATAETLRRFILEEAVSHLPS